MGGSNEVAWRPSADYVADSTLAAFLRTHGIPDVETLVRRSNTDPGWYWDTIMRYFGIRFETPYHEVMDTSDGIPWTRWCVGGTTNLVLNCLDRHTDPATQEKPAVVWEGEDGMVRTWTYQQLQAETGRLAGGLRSLGLGKGDAIGIYMPMRPETLAAFFAVAKIGGIVVPLFSGFGADAVASRLRDAGSVAVLTADGSRRRGKVVGLKAVLDEAAPSIPSLRHVVVLRQQNITTHWLPGRDHDWRQLTARHPDTAPTEVMPADAPFMVIYTSGTTGQAKGTVHTHCGFLTKLVADLGLCMDFQGTDRFLWMSDLGWLIGPMEFVVSTFVGATLVLAEGAPDYPQPGRLWRLVQDHRVTYLGLSPTIARMMMRYGSEEVKQYDLSSLRITISSGELWDPETWWWFFTHVCRRRVPNLNVSGGTEIGWGIVTSTVLQPHKPCAFTTGVPGMGTDIVDANGHSVPPGQMGELVLRVPSIGLSRGLWGDPERYLETYWRKIPGLWVHGDWASRDAEGTWYLHGRSDDTLMIAGKRCGPSEVEALLLATGAVQEAAATGIHDPVKGEVVLCACVPRPAVTPDASLAEVLRAAVVKALGPAFRPAVILFVRDLPKTRSMKVMRRVVRAVYEGRDAGDLASLVNPGAVDELRTEATADRQASPR
jgi:acetyl-CoA synthetase